MRIATLGNASVIHTRRWVEHFRARGHEVRVWSLEPPPPGFEAARLPSAPLPGALRYPLAVPALARALGRFAPDLIDAHYVPNYGLMAALADRHPLSVAAWGSDLLVAGSRDPLQRARARFVLRRADLVLADACNLGDAARALGAPADRVHVVPWGVDLTRFRDRGTRVPGLIASTRMHETVYDIPTVLAGVAPVLERHADVRLVVAGDGTLRESLEALAARTLPAGQVQFVGRLEPDAVAELLARADVYVSASRSDSTSVSLLEAMGSGAVPVVSDIPGNREWVDADEGAQLFAPGDAVALTRGVETALADAAWAAAARARNRAVVEARGDAARNMTEVERLFQALGRATR